LNLLRLCIRWRHDSWGRILRRSRLWLILILGIVVLSQTDLFLHSARMPPQTGAFAVPVPIYGPAVYVYAVLFVCALIALIIGSWRDLRQTSGSEHAELAFLIVGALTILVGTLLISFVLDFFDPESRHALIIGTLICEAHCRISIASIAKSTYRPRKCADLRR